jgi:hypothetical protein
VVVLRGAGGLDLVCVPGRRWGGHHVDVEYLACGHGWCAEETASVLGGLETGFLEELAQPQAVARELWRGVLGLSFSAAAAAAPSEVVAVVAVVVAVVVVVVVVVAVFIIFFRIVMKFNFAEAVDHDVA